ncbi:MAG: FtsW/RodA/SpoVE family cell cycle protein, partial [Phycisphaerae bacterium]|nr:FtsW/RodA/SpoVE family cell cycle protein [Phycisphaerae bacterium]
MIQNRSIQDYIFVIVVALMAIGALFVFSAAADINQQIQLDNFYRFTALRQLMFFPLAVMVMVCFSFFNYRKLAIPNNFLKSPAVWLMILSIIFSAAVLFPKFGTEINYARRWLRIPLGSISLSFQPSELAKWSTIFFVSAYCDRFHDSLGLYRKRFIPICTIVAFVVGLILIEDFGTAAFIAILSFIILIAAGVKFTHILTLAPPALVAFLVALFSSKARIARITAFLNPSDFADSANYQANQSLIALGSGEVWGKGLGRGICKYGHLPEDTTDFIFAIIGEEMGLIGTAAVIILFMFF